MNAGIADAANLAWLLAAHLNGWAPEAILDAYERERMPITEQVSHFAMGHAIAAMKHRREVPPEVEAAGEVGEKARAAFGRNVYALNVQQYCCGGLNFGYFYDQSPLIAYDGEAHPPYTMFDFNPSSVPGCRTPWFKANGESIYDLMGRDYALLRFDRGVNVEGLLAAAEQRGVPMRLIDIEAPVDAPYKHRLVLSRPDQHVAWRGDQAPKEPEALIDRIRGAA
jgi:hypothetical protein